jgi:hypothetical protein
MTKKIEKKEYKILRGYSREGLEVEVEKALESGAELVGGVSVDDAFYQAVII